MENDAAAAAVEVVKRRVQIDPLGPGERLDHPGEHRVRAEIRPDGDGALAEAHPAVGHEHRRVGAMLDAQPLANRAPAQRAVEREVMRRQLVEAAAARIADSVLAVAIDGPARLAGLVAHPRDVDDSLAQVERRFDRVGKPGTGRPVHDRPVHNHLDLVLAAVAQLGGLVQADRLAVDPYPGKARGPQLVPERLVTLAVAPLEGRHHVDLGPLGQVQDLFDDLVGGLRADRHAALGAIRMPQPGKQDAQVIINFGDRARPSSAGSCWSFSARYRSPARGP